MRNLYRVMLPPEGYRKTAFYGFLAFVGSIFLWMGKLTEGNWLIAMGIIAGGFGVGNGMEHYGKGKGKDVG